MANRSHQDMANRSHQDMAIAFVDLSVQHGPGAAGDLDHLPSVIADKAERTPALPQALPKPVALKAFHSLSSSGKSLQ